MSLEVFPFLCFGRIWVRLVVTFFQMFGRIHQWTIWSWIFGCLRKFLVTNLAFLLVIHFFRFPGSSWFSLLCCMLLRIYPFLLDCPICCHKTVYSNLLWIFVFVLYRFNISLSFLILFESFLFFLGESS